METRAHHFLIGLFSVFAVGAVLAFALWMGGDSSNNHYEIYDVLFDEAVSGLSKGSTVEFKGIRIGSVDDLRIDPTNPQRIRARIRVDADAPIYANTRARLHTTSITGLSTITLSAGSGEPLNPRAGEIPVIATEQSSLSKLINSGEDVIFNANDVLIQARYLFSERNLTSVQHILENIENTTNALAAGQKDMRQTLDQLALASAQANAVLAEASRLVTNANRLLDEQGQSTFNSAKRSMAALEHTMQGLDKLLTDNHAPLDAGIKALADLGPAVAELRMTLASLRTIARRLEERPADYLLGREPTREFKP